MVEIVLLYFLCKSIGEVLNNKGRIPIGYQVLAVMMWFGGEMVALFGYVFFLLVSAGEPTDVLGITTWIVGICGGGLGGGIAYLIAQAMPPVRDPTLQEAYTSYGAVQPDAAAQSVQTYDSLEEYTNLSSAKYLQNYGN